MFSLIFLAPKTITNILTTCSVNVVVVKFERMGGRETSDSIPGRFKSCSFGKDRIYLSATWRLFEVTFFFTCGRCFVIAVLRHLPLVNQMDFLKCKDLRLGLELLLK